MPEGDLEEEPWLKIGVAATLAKEYAGDQRQLLETVAGMLENALPEETTVERRGGLFAKKRVTAVTVQVGDDRYGLQEAGHGPLRATHTRVVRGIALKTEEIAADEWLATVAALLDERARASAAVRSALSRFVG